MPVCSLLWNSLDEGKSRRDRVCSLSGRALALPLVALVSGSTVFEVHRRWKNFFSSTARE